MTAEQLAEAIKMATWFTTGHDDHLRSPAWNIAHALLHEHKRAEAAESKLAEREDELAKADACVVAGYEGCSNEYLNDAGFEDVVRAARKRHAARQQLAAQEGEPDFVKLSEMFADEVTERERAGAPSDDVIKCLSEFGERMYRLGLAARPKVEDAVDWHANFDCAAAEVMRQRRERAAVEAKLAEREDELAKADACVVAGYEGCSNEYLNDAGFEDVVRAARKRHAARQQQKASAEPTESEGE